MPNFNPGQVIRRTGITYDLRMERGLEYIVAASGYDEMNGDWVSVEGIRARWSSSNFELVGTLKSIGRKLNQKCRYAEREYVNG